MQKHSGLASFLILFFLINSNYVLSQQIPENARKSIYGDGWDCNRGYYKAGAKCLPVKIPENGELTILGNDWDCQRGFYKAGNRCLNVIIPKNGKLTILGNDWDCIRGYYKAGDECHKVKIPVNGKLTILGNDWDCIRGYHKAGNLCHKINIPDNGKLTILGNDWECIKGFKKSANKCIPMTPEDIKKQKDFEKALIERIRRQQTQGVSGENCIAEYKTNAQVCITATNASLDCRKSYDGNSYRSCDVVINYNVSTDYRGNAYLDVNVGCNANIEYKGTNTYFWRSDYNSGSNNHSLYAYDSTLGSMYVDFSFSYFSEVTSVKVDYIDCEVQDVYLY